MKSKRYLYGLMGLLSLLGFIGIFTEAKSFLGFFAFAVDFEYFFIAVDSDEYDCVPQSVWECESGWDCGTCDGGYDGEYGCGDSVL